MLESPLFGVFGRAHVMVLHLPIGVMIALLMVEGLAMLRRKPMPREARLVLAWLGALCAVVSVLAGLQLSRESAYSHDGVWLHQWLGIGAGVMAVVAAVLAQAGKTAAYLGALVVCVGVLVPAGHFGAGLSHGDGFLFEPLQSKKPPVPIRGGDGETPAPVRGAEPARVEGTGTTPVATRGGPIAGLDPAVGAIFQSSCVSCHNSTKLKGGLALDTVEGLQNGGDDGAVVTAGKPESSEMMMRFKLTPGDKEHMPPPGRTALTAAEVEVIRAWIANAGLGTPKGP